MNKLLIIFIVIFTSTPVLSWTLWNGKNERGQDETLVYQSLDGGMGKVAIGCQRNKDIYARVVITKDYTLPRSILYSIRIDGKQLGGEQVSRGNENSFKSRSFRRGNTKDLILSGEKLTISAWYWGVEPIEVFTSLDGISKAVEKFDCFRTDTK